MSAPLVALAVLFALDALTTIYVIERQAGREANPFMHWLMEVFGVRGALLLSKGLLLALMIYLAPAYGAWLWALVAAYVGVVGWNVRQIVLGRRRGG